MTKKLSFCHQSVIWKIITEVKQSSQIKHIQEQTGVIICLPTVLISWLSHTECCLMYKASIYEVIIMRSKFAFVFLLYEAI